MPEPSLVPLSFAPIYQYRLWGGRRLADWLALPLPGDGPIGEAWLLSDRDDHSSRVADGPFKDQTIGEMMSRAPKGMLGRLAPRYRRFPLLLKFLDATKRLSVQVHPADDDVALIPAGDTGKTEAWVVLGSDPGSRIYAGLAPGVTAADLRSLSSETADARLAHFAPTVGEAVLIEAGTVHTLGDGVVVFEAQENSDVTFRLYDWGHIDPKTGQGRPLQIDQALACVNFAQGAVRPIEPRAEVGRERLIDCAHFTIWRVRGDAPFDVGAPDEPRVLVCIGGEGDIEFGGEDYRIAKGAVTLLPAALGVVRFRPRGEVALLELGLPRAP
jgi:mannose-6-phosphate isomerase